MPSPFGDTAQFIWWPCPTGWLFVTALVTGGSRGIGRAIAERLAKDGAIVALTYNASKAGADEVVAAIHKSGGSAFALHADLVYAERIPDLFDKLDIELTSRNGGSAVSVR